MYRDVKKKLLSVALCICMIIGMVQVVPKAKAETAENTVTGTVDEVETKITYTLSSNTLTYNGSAQLPTLNIRSVTIKKSDGSFGPYGGEISDLRLIGCGSTPVAGGVDAGNYTCMIKGDGKWKLDNHMINYSIAGQSISNIKASVKSTSYAMEYKGDGIVVCPSKENVVVTATVDGEPNTTIDPSQYEVSSTSYKCGEATCTVTVKNTNYVSSSDSYTAPADYIIAYNMSTSNGFSGSIDKTNISYSNNMVLPRITFHAGGVEIDDVQDKTEFSVKYYKKSASNNYEQINGKPASAGNYRVEVSPINTYVTYHHDAVSGHYLYFIGTYSADFTVSAKDGSDLRVTAKNEKELPVVISAGEKLVLTYNGSAVKPEIVVEAPIEGTDPLQYKDITKQCLIEYPDANKAGVAEIRVTPNAETTNYSGETLTYYYYIKSGISFSSFNFGGIYGDGITSIVYDGQDHQLNKCVVVNSAGQTITRDVNYEISYEYSVDGGKTYQSATSELHRKSVGKKRVKATGKGTAYEGQEAYLLYEILPVDITNGTEYSKNVKIEFDESSWTYTGRAIEPAFTFIYGSAPVGTSANTDGQFTYSYENNVNAGAETAILKIKGTGDFTGTYSKTFSIEQLDFGLVSYDQNITYTGSGLKPEFKIGDYVLNGNPVITDYTVSYYDGDPENTTAPSEGGRHSITIQIQNTANIFCGSSYTKTFEYTIVPKNIADLDIHLDPKDVNSNSEIAWNGGDTKPGIIVPDSLTEGTDYKVEYRNYSGVSANTAPATSAAITITGIGNNYTGEKVLRYTITPRVLTTSEEFTYSIDASTNITPEYTLTVNLTDHNRQTADQLLKVNIDYTIENVFYYDDANDVWETLATGSAFRISGNKITGLKKAGKYKVKIAGIGNYVGNLTNESSPVSCGKDISNYIPHIDDEETEYTYIGASITPAAISLYKDVNTKDQTITSDCYSISYARAEGGDDTKNVGKIHVIVTGNPEKGYFGKTKIMDVKKSYYEIIAPRWSPSKPLTVMVLTGSGIMYEPNELTVLPEVIVSFGALSLKKNKDYEVSYDPTAKSAGKNKIITITGIGNYAYESNVWTVKYDVLPVDIRTSNPQIDLTVNNADYGKGETSFTIKYGNYVLEAGNDKDYTYAAQAVSGSTIYWNEAEQSYQTTYKVVGKNNFTGERVITINVNKSSLSVENGTVFTKDGETPQTGEYYVTWSTEEMYVNNPDRDLQDREKCKPEKFSINYKTETGSIPLTKDKDYKVLTDSSNYGTNATPGYSENNYLTIEGMGGYTGTRKIYFTLYSDISKVKLAPVSTLQETTIASPTAIAKSVWKDAYEASTDEDKSHGLVELLTLYEKEGGYIDKSEYTLSWPKNLNLADPAVGTYTMSIVGNPVVKDGSHYYRGNRDVKFTIVNGIEGAEIKVNSNNCVQYTGQPMTVTGPATTLSVKVDEVSLVLGRDFEIIGYENNTEIGEAIVKIKGIGNYQGEAQGTFYITYPLSKMGVQMRDVDNNWVDVSNGSNVSFQYNHAEKEPMLRLYCKEFEADPSNPVHTFTETGGYFETEYLNNTNAGTATARIKNCKYFTSDSGYRDISFTIEKNSICPATQGSITYSPVAAVNGNLSITYTGKDITVDDLRLVLSDGGNQLEYGTDYTVFYKNDNRNVSVTGSEPVITVKGLGNYDDDYSFAYRITPKDINDGITAQPVTITYTGGTIDAAVKQQLNVVQDDIAKTLKCDEDYEIIAYYLDQYGYSLVTGENGIPNAQGTYYAKIQGKGNYTGSRLVQINVSQKDMSEGMTISFTDSEHCKVSLGEPQCVYDGAAHEPGIVVTYGSNTTLIPNVDYTVAFTNNLNAGDAEVTVTGIGNYTGTTSRTFKISPKQITDVSIYYSPIEEVYPFKDGDSVEPENMQIKDTLLNNYLLLNSIDYEITYLSEYDALERQDGANLHSYAGQVTMTIKGQGNYTGTQEFTYYIGEDISQSYTLVNGRNSVSVDYNGLVQAPDENDITVVWGASSDLTDANGEKRYDIAYYRDGFEKSNLVTRDQIVNAGTYYVAVIGVPSKGTYAKSSVNNSCTYTINPRSIAPSYILVSGYDGTYYYTGQQIQPKGIAVEDTDLPVSSDENDPQRRTVKLINGTDYDLSYANNVAAGKASIIVTGKGNYTGNRMAYFNILSSDTDGNNTWDGTSEGTGSISDGTTTIAASDIILGYDNSAYNCMMYNGYERIPTVTINGISTNEFIITASNNIRPGVATLTITGRGNNFTGTIIKNYKIKANLATYGNIAAIADQVYTGYQITPHVTLTCGGNLLNQGSDYTVTYLNNTNVGRATVMANAANDSYYIGTATGSFNISNTAGGMEITGYGYSYTYTGYPIAPDIVVTMNGRVLNRGTDYTVTYSNNTNVGTATMTVTGIGSFSGTKTINYTIEAKNIENCLTTAVTNYQYTGNTYTPNVTVTDSSNGKTLVAGTDYTITYSNNTNPGTASITVTALSKNYTGSKVIPFKITSAAVSGLRTSTIKNNSIKLAWTAQDYADGYQICNSNNRVVATTSKNSYTVKGLTSCTTYKFKVRSYVENADGSVSYGNFSTAVSAKTRLNTPTLKAKSTSKGKVTLTWTKVAKATGYEIYYSTKKDGIYTRLKTISKSSSRKYVDSGLASGEKYYYTIRAYRTSNGVKTYSNYNTIKSVKVK